MVGLGFRGQNQTQSTSFRRVLSENAPSFAIGDKSETRIQSDAFSTYQMSKNMVKRRRVISTSEVSNDQTETQNFPGHPLTSATIHDNRSWKGFCELESEPVSIYTVICGPVTNIILTLTLGLL